MYVALEYGTELIYVMIGREEQKLSGYVGDWSLHAGLASILRQNLAKPVSVTPV